MKNRITALWLACAMVLCTGATVLGTPVSSFVFDKTNYSVAPGGTVDVTVYWRQTVAEGEMSVLDPSFSIGMFGQGVQVRWDDPIVPTNPATVQTTSGIVYNSAFESTTFLNKGVTDSYAQVSEATFSDFVYGTEVSPGVWQQKIGTFSFQAESLPGEVTHLLATKYVNPTNGLGDYIVDANGDAYDSATAVAKATITTTPEPSTFVLGGIAALALLAFRCCNRRRARTVA